MAAPTIPKSRPRANKAALRDAVAALNSGSPEDYLALFRADATLHGFPAGVEDGRIAECWNLPTELHAVAS